MTLRELQKAVFKTAVEHGWYEGQDDFLSRLSFVPARIALIHSELSEALEEYRDPDRAITSVYVRDGSPKPEGFGIEIADAMIRILDMAEAMGLDMEDLILQKMKYNETRPYRHGGKRV